MQTHRHRCWTAPARISDNLPTIQTSGVPRRQRPRMLTSAIPVGHRLQPAQRADPRAGHRRLTGRGGHWSVPVPGVAVADDYALITRQHPADRRPVTGMHAGQIAGAGQVHLLGPARRAGRVSSACTAGAVFSSVRTRFMKPLASTSPATLPQIPAIQPSVLASANTVPASPDAGLCLTRSVPSRGVRVQIRSRIGLMTCQEAIWSRVVRWQADPHHGSASGRKADAADGLLRSFAPSDP